MSGMTHWLFFAWKLTFLRTQGRLQSSNWLDIVVMMMMMMIMMTKKDDLQRAMMPSQQVELHSKNWAVIVQHFLIITISIVIITMFKIVTHPSILIKAAFLLLSYLPFNVPLNAVNENFKFIQSFDVLLLWSWSQGTQTNLKWRAKLRGCSVIGEILRWPMMYFSLLVPFSYFLLVNGCHLVVLFSYPLMFSDPWNLPFCFFSFIDDSFLHPAFFLVSASLDYCLLKHSYLFPKQPLHLLNHSIIYDWFNKPCLSVSICAKQAPAGVFHLHITILIFGFPE